MVTFFGWEGKVTAGLVERDGSLPASWLPVHRDQLRVHRSVTLEIFTFTLHQAFIHHYIEKNYYNSAAQSFQKETFAADIFLIEVQFDWVQLVLK